MCSKVVSKCKMTVGCRIYHKAQNIQCWILQCCTYRSQMLPKVLYTADTLGFIVLTILMVCEECQFQSVQNATVTVHSYLDSCPS